MLPIPNPIAFNLFGLEIHWYAIIMVFAIIVAFSFGYIRISKFEVTDDDLIDYFICVIPSAIIGARLYYVIFQWNEYKNDLWQIFAIRNGGLAVHGALIAGILATYFFCKYKKYNFLKFLDLAAPCMILGQSIGRWGNYFNMEAHGRITDLPWGIPIYDLAGDIRYVHPTFLYESIWDLIVFFFLVYYQDHLQKKCGETACLYLALYSLGRFFIEGLRTDSLMFFGLRQAQLLSVTLFVLSIIGFFYLRKKGKPFELLSAEQAKAFREAQKVKRQKA